MADTPSEDAPRPAAEDRPRPAPWWGRPEFILALATLLTTIFTAITANRTSDKTDDNGVQIKQVNKSVNQTPGKTANILLGLPPDEGHENNP